MNTPQPNSATPKRWYQRKLTRWLFVCAVAAAIVIAILVHSARQFARNIDPMLRDRIIQTVSQRFNAPVQLDRVDISALKGLQVDAYGLRVYDPHANSTDPSHILVAVRHLTFRTDIRSLRHSQTKLGLVYLQGLELHIPPAGRRGNLLPQPAQRRTEPLEALLVSHITCDDAKLFIDTDKPGKLPLEFDITHLELSDLGWSQSLRYDALLTNPKPTGIIHAVGSFGPWQDQEPRATPIDGNYNFDHADLNSIRGLGGILSSTGHFTGQLQAITVDGTTNTPDFSLDVSEHPVPLRTQFHALVDGTSGDTFLDPVHAQMLHSEFTASGKIVRSGKAGHDIHLDVVMTRARIEDMLRLAVKISPPVMRGALAMHAHLHIPPGDQRVAEKLSLAGAFDVRGVQFSNAETQDKVDSLSMRAQGRPKEAGEAGSDKTAEVHSEMKATFALAGGTATVTNLDYEIPGAKVLLNGVYSLNGKLFEFKGHVRTDATASHMVTGWKSWLLKPVDPFLKKNGAGLELPIEVSGTRNAPHFGLALHGSSNESTDQMKADLKARRAQDAAIRAQARAARKDPLDGP